MKLVKKGKKKQINTCCKDCLNVSSCGLPAKIRIVPTCYIPARKEDLKKVKEKPIYYLEEGRKNRNNPWL